MKKIFRNSSFTPALLFGIGSVAWLLTEVAYQIYLGNSAGDIRQHGTYVDIQLHDTYYVIGVIAVMRGLAGCFAIFCGIYFLFPKIFGRPLNRAMGRIHFWGSFVASWLIIWPRWMGYQDYNRFISIAVLLLLLAQLLFIFNLLYSLFARNPALNGRQIRR